MKKLLIGLSASFNVLVILVASLLFSGWLNPWIMPKILGPGYERWVSQFELYSHTAGGVVFLGDSITEGAAWEELFPGVHTRNRGISGDTSHGVLARLDQVIAIKPEKVFLMIGTNDLGMNIPAATITGNIRDIVKRLNSALPETRLYVQSVLPRSAEYRDQVEALNQSIAQNIEGKAQWINLYPLYLSDQGNIKPAYSNDELHLFGEGYRLWRDTIAEHVEEPPI